MGAKSTSRRPRRCESGRRAHLPLIDGFCPANPVHVQGSLEVNPPEFFGGGPAWPANRPHQFHASVVSSESALLLRGQSRCLDRPSIGGCFGRHRAIPLERRLTLARPRRSGSALAANRLIWSSSDPGA